MYVCMHVSIYIFTYVYIHICIYSYTEEEAVGPAFWLSAHPRYTSSSSQLGVYYTYCCIDVSDKHIPDPLKSRVFQKPRPHSNLLSLHIRIYSYMYRFICIYLSQKAVTENSCPIGEGSRQSQAAITTPSSGTSEDWEVYYRGSKVPVKGSIKGYYKGSVKVL